MGEMKNLMEITLNENQLSPKVTVTYDGTRSRAMSASSPGGGETIRRPWRDEKQDKNKIGKKSPSAAGNGIGASPVLDYENRRSGKSRRRRLETSSERPRAPSADFLGSKISAACRSWLARRSLYVGKAFGSRKARKKDQEKVAGIGIGRPPRASREFPGLENFRCLQVLAG